MFICTLNLEKNKQIKNLLPVQFIFLEVIVL